MKEISRWMEVVTLKLAKDKTETLLVNGRKQRQTITLTVGEQHCFVITHPLLEIHTWFISWRPL